MDLEPAGCNASMPRRPLALIAVRRLVSHTGGTGPADCGPGCDSMIRVPGWATSPEDFATALPVA